MILLSFIILYSAAFNVMGQEFPDTVIGISLSEYRVYLKNHASLDRLYSNVFIVGCHHAREWISVEIPLLFAKYLPENYNLDPQVQKVVEGAQIYIMPTLSLGLYTLTRARCRPHERHCPGASRPNIPGQRTSLYLRFPGIGIILKQWRFQRLDLRSFR